MKRKKIERARLDEIAKLRADLRRFAAIDSHPTVRILELHLGSTGRANVLTFPILRDGPLPRIDLPSLGYRVRAITGDGHYILDQVEARSDTSEIERFAEAVRSSTPPQTPK